MVTLNIRSIYRVGAGVYCLCKSRLQDYKILDCLMRIVLERGITWWLQDILGLR
jgi:hypothetical protein